jgi:hypothetical protein
MNTLIKGRVILLVLGAITLLSVPAVFAQGKIDKALLKDIVTKELNQKTKLVGTFDLYEETTKKVRNLRMMSVEDPVEDKSGLHVPVKFRDNSSGDMVTVDALLQKSNDTYKVTDWKIAKIEAAPQVEKKDSYTDEEVRQVIDEYLAQQTKFTDSLMFFDPKIENMRKLQLVGFKNNYRHFGILTIETADFKDITTGETLTMDIHVKNNKGVLEFDSLKIKKIAKGTQPPAAQPAEGKAQSPEAKAPAAEPKSAPAKAPEAKAPADK